MSTDLPHMTPIISGQTCIGFLLSTARGVAAYDRSEKSLGIFADVMAAAVAIEKSVAPACPGCSE
jgi:hypothetical protein